jgi:Histidine carboxylase PI chain
MADPLRDATERLFGVDKRRRFNPLPGSMVVCANNSYTSSTDEAKNSCWVWCAIAIAIAQDPTAHANSSSRTLTRFLEISRRRMLTSSFESPLVP